MDKNKTKKKLESVFIVNHNLCIPIFEKKHLSFFKRKYDYKQ